ncbi:type A chloramphenicol O-acetyltransferase [Fictibacillus barbaricus]|uniref:Chloramphenicol O-acetyltransferase type A n=1 Tax=Fictibacillus barbaricus TaxID=182136 RepID=A0ABU1TWV0_9BACL|nr:type A chloramphenicol O-acetyltransferase [Fictibacillus barbaricus]MDR7071668.1 chloramphenicol O-acetyltransferase type A [Fictibacillus barbaricus]
MKFHYIDKDNWDRKEYFEHYLNQKCTFSITVNLDITLLLQQLKSRDIKLYPAFIYMVSRVVNSHKEFRTSFSDDGQLGFWKEMSPSYTIFHKDNKSFSSIWTNYSTRFARFYENFKEDGEKYGEKKGLFPKPDEPKNTFPISSIPWVNFTGFNLNINNDGNYLLPIITSGKYFTQDDNVWLPVSLQVHHGVCDGYHAGLFFEEMQVLTEKCLVWLDD